MNLEIDIERLRNDLINYYGTAMMTLPIAMMEVINVENATYEELIELAIKNNIDLNNYIIDNYYSKRR